MFSKLFQRRPTAVVLDGDAPIGENGLLNETFGIRIYDGTLAPFATRGDAYPREGSYTFSTNEDNQDQITLFFFRGTDTIAENCKYLGEVRLRGFGLGPAKEPLVRLYFKLADNMITLWAEDEKEKKVIQVSIVKDKDGVSIH